MFNFFELFFILRPLENRVRAIILLTIWVFLNRLRVVVLPANTFDCILDATQFQNVFLVDLILDSFPLFFEAPDHNVHILMVGRRRFISDSVLGLKLQVKCVIDLLYSQKVLVGVVKILH